MRIVNGLADFSNSEVHYIMKKMILTVIGGGSVNWMRGLMRDIYLVDEFSGGEIRLVDPKLDHTQSVAAMLHKFNELRGKDYKISIVEDRREALKDADFVLMTFSPGAMEAYYNDIEIPVKYGIRQPVSMTVGPCGISAAVRTIPVCYDIVKEMEELCPGAWVLNYTNPMSVLTRAMFMASKTVKVLGMCHGFHDFGHLAGPLLGLPKPEGMGLLEYLYHWLPEQGLEYKVAGLNHFIFLTKAELNGRDMLPVVREYCKKFRDLGEGTGKTEGNESPFRSDMGAAFAICRQLGYIPINADRHTIEFWPSLCNVRNGYGMKYGVQKTTVDYRNLMKIHQKNHIDNVAKGITSVDWSYSGEEMVEIIKAIANGTSFRGIVNVPNKGQISNLPKDVIVETFGVITKDGVIPEDSGELPGSIGTLSRLHADIHELTVRAALEGSRELFIEALSLDPLSAGADFCEIPQMAEELLEANKQWLPRFF